MSYDEESFWFGYLLGQQARGWSAYVRGIGPDVARYITEYVPRLSLLDEHGFSVRPLIAVPESSFPDRENKPLSIRVDRLRFGSVSFGIRAITEQADEISVTAN